MSPYLRTVAVLAFAFVVVVAGTIGWALAEDRYRNEATEQRQRAELAERQGKAMQRVLERMQTLPDVAMREFSATQTVTFTIDGKPLTCIGLLTRKGSVKTMSCDWEGWRNSP